MAWSSAQFAGWQTTLEQRMAHRLRAPTFIECVQKSDSS